VCYPKAKNSSFIIFSFAERPNTRLKFYEVFDVGVRPVKETLKGTLGPEREAVTGHCRRVRGNLFVNVDRVIT
jgi:hypothetical protein